jgi:hypothetical protein
MANRTRMATFGDYLDPLTDGGSYRLVLADGGG